MQRAVGIVRVSRSAGREGESFVSPREQAERIASACKRDGLEIVDTHQEIDVSGGTPLAKREGLRTAVEAVEDGKADVVMVAYFDRLVRSLAVQGEVVQRVEAAGGRVVALDVGQISEGSAAQWLSGTMLGAVAEYHRRTTKERAGRAQAEAVARGVAPFDGIPPGYSRGPDKVMVPNDDAPAIQAAYLLRADGATIKEVRAFLRERGIERSYHGVQSLLGSRIYLGEIRFGELVNTEAHKPLIERGLWETVQRTKVTRGRRAKSDRLLARLGVLHCGTCGARMTVGHQTQNGRNYPFYRCPPVGDCPQRVTISAAIVESFVVEHVRAELENVEGRASAEADAAQADAELTAAQSALDSAIRAFAGLESEAATRERLGELREARDSALVKVEHLRSLQSVGRLGASTNWDNLSSAARRTLIRLIVHSVTVSKQGLGRERLSITLREDAPGLSV